jgi:hypothetical protein
LPAAPSRPPLAMPVEEIVSGAFRKSENAAWGPGMIAPC